MGRCARVVVVALASLLCAASSARALFLREFVELSADSDRRIAIVEAICLRDSGDAQPPLFRTLHIVRGAAPDTFTASSDFGRALWRRFDSGRAYLLGLSLHAPHDEYTVVRRFQPSSLARYSASAVQDLSERYVSDLGGRDSVLEAATVAWDSCGRAPIQDPGPKWSAVRRDSEIVRLLSVMKREPPNDVHSAMPFNWNMAQGELLGRPDSVIFRLGYALWDTARTMAVRTLALELIAADTSEANRRWFRGLEPTGEPWLDGTIAWRLERDTSVAARSLSRRLFLASEPGSRAEFWAASSLWGDTSQVVWTEVRRRLIAGHTRPYAPPVIIEGSNAPADNWLIATFWTNAEAWRAFDDSSSRMRIVATRVLCWRGQSAASDRAMHRLQSRRGPQNQPVDSAELASTLEVLAAWPQPGTEPWLCQVARRGGAASRSILVRLPDSPRVRRMLRALVAHSAPGDSSIRTLLAIGKLASWRHREDLPVFHRLAAAGSDGVAETCLGAIGQLEGVQAMAEFIAERYHGHAPPLQQWRTFVGLEERFRQNEVFALRMIATFLHYR